MAPSSSTFPSRGQSAAALALLVFSGCGAPPESAPELGVVQQAAGGSFYELGFEIAPPKIPAKTVILTFDDGPDWGADTNEDPAKGYTAQVLDILKEKGVSATFFINRDNWSTLDDDPDMQEIVRRMVREGHELGSHTYHHYSLSDQAGHFTEESLMWHPDTPRTDLSEAQIETELSGVEDIVDTIFGAGKQRMSLFRAPYGEPFQSGAAAKNYDLAKGVVQNHAVHIGWNIDSKDYECIGDYCAFDRVKMALEAGAHGVILMHSVQAQEVASLPMVIDYLKAEGYAFWSVEQAVCATYGKYSKDLVDDAEGTCDPNDDTTEPQPGDGDGDGTGDGSGDGDGTGSGDGDADGSAEGDGGGDGDGAGDGNGGGGTTIVKKSGCSLAPNGASPLALFAALALSLALVRRRRAR